MIEHDNALPLEQWPRYDAPEDFPEWMTLLKCWTVGDEAVILILILIRYKLPAGT